MNESPLHRATVFRIALVLGVSTGIFLLNTFSHPWEESYDHPVHSATIEKNAKVGWSLRYLLPQDGVDLLQTNPPYYWFILGKMWGVYVEGLGRIANLEPPIHYHFFRLAHLAFIILVASLYSFSLVPRLCDNGLLIKWFALCLFLLPNLYLSQVMVRSDHLLLLFLNLLFYLWFRFDFAGNLWTSGWRVASWSGCIIGMSNTRHFAVVGVALFFLWGCAGLRTFFPAFSAGRKLLVTLLLLLTIVLSAHHYVLQFAKTGYLFSQPLTTDYYKKYHERQKNFSRWGMFTNMEFHLLWNNPNRTVRFTEGNSFLPRLFSDMWGDHWLYFSGPKFSDKKVTFKRIVLVLAIPFTLLYFGVPLFLFGTYLVRTKLLEAPHWRYAASALFVGAIILLGLFVYLEPEVGKNATVKFSYLLGYQWMPLFSLLGFLEHRPVLSRVVMAYTCVLWVSCLPLYVYWR